MHSEHRGGAALDPLQIGVPAFPTSAYALKMAESVDFACIIADCRMPETDGIELLGRFAERQPDCARILLSDEVATSQLALARRRMLLENRRLANLPGG